MVYKHKRPRETCHQNKTAQKHADAKERKTNECKIKRLRSKECRTEERRVNV